MNILPAAQRDVDIVLEFYCAKGGYSLCFHDILDMFIEYKSANPPAG